MTQADRTPALGPPRAIGTLHLSTKSSTTGSGLDRFRTSGATKVAFPRHTDRVEGIVLNTSGGLTGGDRFQTELIVGAKSHLVLTTQAAERGYRSPSGTARVRTQVRVEPGAVFHWLPQELIVFDGAAVDRCLSVELAPDSEAVVVEPIIFGRSAMGETCETGRLRDTIALTRNSAPLYTDRIHLNGPIQGTLDRPAVMNGAQAVASVLYAGARAAGLLTAVRKLLPATAGASLRAPDLLCLRCVAPDSFLLRRVLIPVLELLTARPLPKSWSL